MLFGGGGAVHLNRRYRMFKSIIQLKSRQAIIKPKESQVKGGMIKVRVFCGVKESPRKRGFRRVFLDVFGRDKLKHLVMRTP